MKLILPVMVMAILYLSAHAMGQPTPGCSGPIFELGTSFPMNGYVTDLALADLDSDGSLDLIAALDSSSFPGVIIDALALRFGDGQGGFGTPQYIPMPARPWSIAVADVDQDGHQDLAVSSAVGTVSIMLGDGAGGLTVGATMNFGNTAIRGIDAGDLDGNGTVDLVISVAPNTCCNGGWLAVLLGDGQGSFSPTTLASATTGPDFVRLADVNLDGSLDLLVTDAGADIVAVHLGNGAGGFAAPSSHALANDPTSVAVGDLNQDGFPDLAVSRKWTSNNVAILFGDGQGGFSAPTSLTTASGAEDIAIADLDLDGDLDIAVANDWSDNISILLGDGQGGFVSTNYPATNGPWSIAVGDLNGDGRPDVAAGNHIGRDVSVAWGNLQGTFGSQILLPVGSNPKDVEIADIDLDGYDDLLFVGMPNVTSVLRGSASGFLPASSIPTGGGLRLVVQDANSDGYPDLALVGGAEFVVVTLSNGQGGFASPTTLMTDASAFELVSGDFNQDGAPDLAAFNDGYPSCAPPGIFGCPNVIPSTVDIFLGNGNGGWTRASYPTAVQSPIRAVAADLDGDGDQDLAISDAVSNAIHILFNNGNGAFGAPVIYGVAPFPTGLGAADVNEDGLVDLIVASRTNASVAIHLGTGAGGFSNAGSVPVGLQPLDLLAHDLDHDGHLDIAVVNGHFATHSVSILKGDGHGTFSLSETIIVGANPSALAHGDFDGDGNRDLVVANELSHDASVLFNQCAALTLDLSQPGGFGSPLFIANHNLTVGTETYNIFSFDACPTGVGQGPLQTLGLCLTSPTNVEFVVAQLLLPVGAAPSHFMASTRSQVFGPFSVSAYGGLTFEGVAFHVAGPAITAVSAARRITLQ